MLLSLIKILVFVAVVAGLTWGAARLTDVAGGAEIAMAGYEVTLGPLQLVLAIALLALLGWLLFKALGFLLALLRFINGDDTAVSRWFSRSRERRGYKALADGMIALASGEGETAMAKGRRAERYLRRPDLTSILVAQGAELAGDRRTAEGAYRELVQIDRTRFVGIRGLMRQRLAEGDTDTAMKLAKKAFELKPRHTETQDTLLRLQAEAHDWTGARATLDAKRRSGSLPRNVAKRRDAVLALSEARDVMDESLSIEAREKAIEANRLSPDLIPAAVMAARSYLAVGNSRYATRVIRKAWEAEPHPDLAQVFAEIAPEENPQARLDRFSVLIQSRPDHPETRMLEAELMIAAERFNEARRALGDLVETDPTARVLTLMAAIERGRGADDAVVRGWLARALTAPRGPQWVCENCHHLHPHWDPVCSNCHAFDTLAWTRPEEGEPNLPRGTEMLPLIVGGAGRTNGEGTVPAVREAGSTASPLPAQTATPASSGPEEAEIVAPETAATTPEKTEGEALAEERK
ncbi:heme biosynthesis HemY N-terminal domain-containing protein [Limimaricola variabilis]|uniref:heme biosynthesis protein HemY n=1 Tax=Limimaricola variabilis TaxID=1492771 RepID=UPI002AC93D2B|nr:heme biosynthesis HemY N-terminal domain-containing protein [Limimaricola variabilis]WPY93665.1 heme biosynthesis HemY N-terminal domain-containing protein [Limimaricola variabilis]